MGAPAASEPTELAPAPIENEKRPSAGPGASSNSGAQGSRSSTGRASYEATGAVGNRQARAGEYVNRALATSPEPASRSARGAGRSLTSTPAAGSESILDNLPPVEVPREWSTNELPAAADTTAPKPQKAEAKADPPAPKTDDSAAAPADVTVAPGIRRFVSLEPKLSGGSLPTPAGLDWLVEKGYKTILDLRETREVLEVQPKFIDEVTKRGLRYVVLPVGLKQVDAEHISRFNDEISQADSRPLYFCDSDGTRSGVLWYIHRITVDKFDTQAATREAEELGLSDKPFWQAATAYLESLTPARPAAASATPPAAAKPAANATPSPTTENPPSPTTDATPPPAQLQAGLTALPTIPLADISATPPPTNDTDSTDPNAWRPFAALVVTGLGVPLAYISRTALPSVRRISRATLAAPARRPKSLPPASGA
jgi:protein tyrosine phosphatase (PTP) superfamily phosphohydrolase (DUF442 family)